MNIIAFFFKTVFLHCLEMLTKFVSYDLTPPFLDLYINLKY